MCLSYGRYSQEDVDREVEVLRGKLLSDGYHDLTNPNTQDSHFLAIINEKKNERFRSAFNISKDYVSGSAFNDEYRANKMAEGKEKKMKEKEQEVMQDDVTEERFDIIIIIAIIIN